jgi:hypothetical protein
MPCLEHVLPWPLAIAPLNNLEARDEKNEQQWTTPKIGLELSETRSNDDVIDDRREASGKEGIREESDIAAAEA